MIKKNTKIGTRVVITGWSKTKGRVGTLLSPVTNWTLKDSCSVRLDATSNKKACNVTILRKNVEVMK